jgi:hypothetical protein
MFSCITWTSSASAAVTAAYICSQQTESGLKGFPSTMQPCCTCAQLPHGHPELFPTRGTIIIIIKFSIFGEWKYGSAILDLGTTWRSVVSYTTWPLYPRGNSWVGPGAGLNAVEKNVLSLPGIEPRPSSPYPVTISTEPSGLLIITMCLKIAVATRLE